MIAARTGDSSAPGRGIAVGDVQDQTLSPPGRAVPWYGWKGEWGFPGPFVDETGRVGPVGIIELQINDEEPTRERMSLQIAMG